jgi:hypothetical protein
VITDRPGARAERWLKRLSWAYDERQIAAPPRPGQHWQLTDPASTRKTAMNRIQRCLAALAGLGATLIILAAAAPAAFASVPASGPTPTSPRPLPPRWYQHHPHLPPGHTYTSRFTSRPFRSPSPPSPARHAGLADHADRGGAALAAAALAVLVDRAWGARRRATAA